MIIPGELVHNLMGQLPSTFLRLSGPSTESNPTLDWKASHSFCWFLFFPSAAYYRGAMGILLVYDVTDESSFNSTHLLAFKIPAISDLLSCCFFQPWSCWILRLSADIRNWIRNIEQHASDNVNKILVGNKADMDESKRVPSKFLYLEGIHNFLAHYLFMTLKNSKKKPLQAVPTSRGQALADEYGIKFFETVRSWPTTVLSLSLSLDSKMLLDLCRVQRQISTWSRSSSPWQGTSSRGSQKTIQSPRWVKAHPSPPPQWLLLNYELSRSIFLFI